MNELIQWPKAKYWDKAWNPIIGCEPCSPACENCYARELFTTRFHKGFEPTQTKQQFPPTKGVIFVGNATDMFGEWVCQPHNYIGLAQTVTACGKATCLWLTKRVQRMCDALSAFEFDDLSNHYFGFTAENQEWYDQRFETWRADAPLGVNGWLSAEPLLGPINLGLQYIAPEDMPFQWIVVGSESGPNRRPCKIEWVESIVEQCLAANVPVFVKQLSIGGKCETDINKFPEHLRIRQVPWAKEGGVK